MMTGAPRLARSVLAATIAALVLTMLAIAPAGATTTVNQGVDQIIRATNDYRVSQGRTRLTHHQGLTDVAQAWAEQMAADFDATSPGPSSSPSSSVFRHNPNRTAEVNAATGGALGSGENIAWNKGFSSPYSQMVTQWINSEGHRLNMINTNYTHIGVGVARSSDGSYFGVQVFAKLPGTVVAPGSLDVSLDVTGISGLGSTGCVELVRKSGSTYTPVADYCVPVVSPITTVRFSDFAPGTYTARVHDFGSMPSTYLGGTASPSATATITGGAGATAFFPVHPTVARVGGATRYDVAVGISQQYFPSGASTVYIATGANFPDALGAAPAAALRDAPLLLVEPEAIPTGVRNELDRLNPDLIIVTGGPASVSASVFTQLGSYATTVTRINGPDRYEVSRKVTRDAFESLGSDVAYIATGATFPDALSASAAAGSIQAPVILLDGQMATLDSATAQLLLDLDVEEIRIAGGPGSVKPGIETALRNLPGVTSVTRLSGADRFVVSGATNRAAFADADTVFIASGYTFPDALAGAPVAGALSAPLYVIPTSCIPGYVLDDIAKFGPTEVRILGGPGSVTPAAAAFARC
jgi:putative cell wall-binding protein/uncharacterized protein YkwD